MPYSSIAELKRGYVEVKPHLAKSFVGIYLDLENYLYFSAAALVVYDFFLTLDREVWSVWRAKQSVSSLLFYGFRYAALLNIIPTLLIRTSLPGLQSNWMALDIIILVCSTVFAALRVYAMFNRSRLLFCLALITGLLNPAISIYIFRRSLPTLDAYLNHEGCMLTIIGDKTSYENARAASVVSDGIVLALTVAKTRTLDRARRHQREDGLVPTLSGILFRDSAYFTSVLLSRLFLDLREVSDTDNSGKSEFLSRTLPSYGPESSDAATQFTEVEALE
ncbi:uncharacterized protein B0H18DRAFT_999938, partial [Fomitopsis serialis]|uniref:uncharacterized protein n=1 Tax=Fomitopsis serialis TaxID=139415 RepID=UPI002008C74A